MHAQLGWITLVLGYTTIYLGVDIYNPSGISTWVTVLLAFYAAVLVFNALREARRSSHTEGHPAFGRSASVRCCALSLDLKLSRLA